METDRYFEIYPEDNKGEYFLEFSSWNSEKVIWQLFKRQYYPKHMWVDTAANPLCSNEVHPWNLGDGVLVDESRIDMNTKRFLRAMVDSLNRGCDFL